MTSTSTATQSFLADFTRLNADEVTIKTTLDGSYVLEYFREHRVLQRSEPHDKQVDAIGADLESHINNTSVKPREVTGVVAIAGLSGTADVNREETGTVSYIRLTI